MLLTIFVIWFIWERLASRILAEPPLRIVLIVSDIVALVLAVIFAFGLKVGI